jgi:hypothetical protein
MKRLSLRVFRPGLDRRGIALPLALIGLLAASLLVTTAVVTSSTEAAISAAHQDATRALYSADGGLQAWVAENGITVMPEDGEVIFIPPGGTSADRVLIRPVHVMDRPLGAGAFVRTFAVSARSQEGGSRQVVAMIRQVFPPGTPFSINAKSAVTLGGNLHVQGNAFTVSGRVQAGDSCATGGVQAVHHADSSKITVNNANHWDNFLGADSTGKATEGTGALSNSGKTRDQLMREVLGLEPGQTLEDIIARVPPEKKWGPRFSPPGGPVRVFDGRVDPGEHVAVVDGNGGYVDLYGVEGLIIVVNGHLRMRGNAQFDGIIIVEGNFDLAGTPVVRGALISLDTDRENVINLDESAIGAGHITVQYNACMIQAAETAFSNIAISDQPPTLQPMVAWSEVVR